MKAICCMLILLGATLVGCASAELEANRRFWSEVAKGETSDDAASDGLVARSVATPRPRGYEIVAAQVLGRPESKSRSADRTASDKLVLRDELLARAEAQTETSRSTSRGLSSTDKSGAGPVPPGLAKHKFTRAFVKAVEAQSVGSERKIKVTPDDAKSFGREIFRVATGGTEASEPALASLIRLYAAAYLDGKFIDRRGVKLEAPKNLEKGLTGDTLAGFVAVGMEAFSDFMFEVPCYKKDGKFINETGEEPTAVTLTIQEGKDVSTTPSDEGITDLEAELISFLSSYAGKKSNVVSGLVVEFFKEAKVQFVVGGSFAVGDSEAFSKMITSFFDVSSRRLTEFYVHEGLMTFRYTLDGDAVNPAIDNPANKAVAILLQEQAWLKKYLH